MNAHDTLRRQLGDSLAQHILPAPERGPSRVPRWWRRPAALALVPVLLAGSVAAATAITGHGQTSEKTARQLHNAARSATLKLPSCRPPMLLSRAALIDGATPPEVLAVLPQLASGSRVPGALAAALLPHLGAAPIIRQSLASAEFPGNLRVVAAVVQGIGFASTADPAACLTARERFVEAQPARDAARVGAITQLRADDDIRPGAQSLWLWRLNTNPTRRGNSTSGVGGVIHSGRPIRTGVLGSGSGGYFGLANPKTRTIDITALRTRKRLRTIKITDGLFAFRLPTGTGPVQLRQRDSTGHVIAKQRLR
jgi:hypothetical protein